MYKFVLMLAGPLIKRILAALGVGTITYTGYTLFLEQVKNAIVNNFTGMAGPAFELAAMMGFQQAVGIMLGALIARMSVTQFKKFGIL